MIAIEPDAVRRLIDQIASGETRYKCQIHVQFAWPPTVIHDNQRYCTTGKDGLRRSDEMPSAEYEADNGRRLWLGIDGVVMHD
jgi:hypothetical protein